MDGKRVWQFRPGILRALIQRDSSSEQRAQLAPARFRKKLAVLALRGKVGTHHRFMLQMHVRRDRYIMQS